MKNTLINLIFFIYTTDDIANIETAAYTRIEFINREDDNIP